jgi:hypothetical protein
MDPPLCGSVVTSHNEVSETGHQRTTKRTSLMKQEISTVTSCAASYVVQQMGARLPGNLVETVQAILGTGV